MFAVLKVLNDKTLYYKPNESHIGPPRVAFQAILALLSEC